MRRPRLACSVSPCPTPAPHASSVPRLDDRILRPGSRTGPRPRPQHPAIARRLSRNRESLRRRRRGHLPLSNRHDIGDRSPRQSGFPVHSLTPKPATRRPTRPELAEAPERRSPSARDAPERTPVPSPRIHPESSRMRKYVVEFIGTFFLVLTIVCSVALSSDASKGIIPPLAIGSALMVMIFAGGHISGAHYNPAVTLAVAIRGRCSKLDVVPYWIAQFAGGLAASFLARYVLLSNAPAEPSLFENIVPPLVAEFLFTFALCYVVLNTATAKGTEGNSFYGLAIGFTVLTGAFAVGSISGGAFNPAVAVSVGAIKMGFPLGQIWVHLAAEFIAAIVAGLTFLFLNPDDK
ncbi:MAG: aquaporin [Isosphaeraceae bacterium]|nr:aquaporin [Isosphaeraceae bacterium]